MEILKCFFKPCLASSLLLFHWPKQVLAKPESAWEDATQGQRDREAGKMRNTTVSSPIWQQSLPAHKTLLGRSSESSSMLAVDTLISTGKSFHFPKSLVFTHLQDNPEGLGPGTPVTGKETDRPLQPVTELESDQV